MMRRDVGLMVRAWGGECSPPPLVGLGREADRGWGEGFPARALPQTPPPNPLPQGEGEIGFRPRQSVNTEPRGPHP